MGQEKTRRTFIQDCSTSAAALVALSATQPVAGADPEQRSGTPYLCITCGTQFAESAQPPRTARSARTSGSTSTPTARSGRRSRTCGPRTRT